jgi:hypothetical protein
MYNFSNLACEIFEHLLTHVQKWLLGKIFSHFSYRLERPNYPGRNFRSLLLFHLYKCAVLIIETKMLTLSDKVYPINSLEKMKIKTIFLCMKMMKSLDLLERNFF